MFLGVLRSLWRWAIEPLTFRRHEKCRWCDCEYPTKLRWVWSEAQPWGRLVRLCDHCVSECAAG